MKDFETRTKNVNNKTLFKLIDDFMIEVFGTIAVTWKNKEHREHLVELIDQWMYDFAVNSGKIVQYDILCDNRNNPASERAKGIIHFTLRYTQKNCYNTTEIDYSFKA